MSVEVSVDFSELADLQKRIERFVGEAHGKGVAKNPVRNASRAMAKVVEGEARAKAPVDTGRLQGAVTKKLIGTQFRDRANRLGNSREYYFVGFRLGRGRDDLSGAWYATPVEVGWRDNHASFPGHHTLKRAAMDKESAAKQEFMDKLRRDLDRIAAKLNREGF